MWLAENEGGIWLATESSLLKKMHLWIQRRQESHKWKASCKFKFNSLHINVTTSKYIFYENCKYFFKLIYLWIYITFISNKAQLCVDQKCVCETYFCWWNLFYIYTYRYPFVCALKCICEKRVIDIITKYICESFAVYSLLTVLIPYY